MTEFIAGVIQQQVKIYNSPLDYQLDLFKYLEMAQAQRAKLVVLPALSPLMLVPPLASNVKLSLFKKRETAKDRLSGLVGKILDKAVVTASQAMGGVKGELMQLLQHYPGEIYDAYIDLFSAAALRHKMTIVAGSFYLREQEDSDCFHMTYVFSPNGMVLGRQKKIHLTPAETGFCRPGRAMHVIKTPVGRLGILIGEDALYPECSRLLASQGAEILVSLTAAAGLPAARQIRHAFLARVDENETLGIQSALVGSNLLDTGAPDMAGKSALLQPFQLSPQDNGIIYELGDANTEGFIAQPLNLEHLKDYWIQSSPRLRQSMQMNAYLPLAQVYQNQKTLDQLYWNPPADNRPEEGTYPDKKDNPPAQTSGEQRDSLLRSPFAGADTEETGDKHP